jgi:hypothetical protein
MRDERILAVRRQECDKFLAPFVRKTRAYPYMLQPAIVIKETQQKGTDCRAFAFFVPAKTGNNAVAVSLMLDL